MKKGKYEAWIDGSYKEVYDKKYIGIGGVLKYNSKPIFSFNKSLVHAEGSSNSAEYLALIEMLNFILENKIDSPLLIRGDSRMVVNQMNGVWEIQQGYYLPYALEAKSKFDSLKNVSIKWTSRKTNKEADYLSKINLIKKR